jgi:hypothetical protein
MNEKRQKYNVPENWEKTCDGAGCRCGAWNSGECGCDADWTPHETYQMMVELNSQQEEIERLRSVLKAAVLCIDDLVYLDTGGFRLTNDQSGQAHNLLIAARKTLAEGDAKL